MASQCLEGLLFMSFKLFKEKSMVKIRPNMERTGSLPKESDVLMRRAAQVAVLGSLLRGRGPQGRTTEGTEPVKRARELCVVLACSYLIN